MDLTIKNKVILAPIPDILEEVKRQSGNRYLNYIGKVKGDTVKITCPWHKNGQESHPSCHVYARRDNPDVYYGTAHCFTCSKAVPLYSLVGHCLNEDDEYGKLWLADNFGDTISTSVIDDLQPIDIDNKNKLQFIDESELEQYNQYHPYMTERKLSFDVLKNYKIGYDSHTEMITFPVWDIHDNLVMITKRSVNTKKFEIPEGVEKPVYLLNFMKNENTVYVCESQINTLTLLSWGYPAIGLIGTGSSKQYEILNKTGIRNYILCFDGDEAGNKGAEKFKKNIRKDVIVTQKMLPFGNDVNDLTKEQFDNLLII